MLALGNRRHVGTRVGHGRATGLGDYPHGAPLPQRIEVAAHLGSRGVAVQLVKGEVVDTNVGVRLFEETTGRAHILDHKMAYPGNHLAVVGRQHLVDGRIAQRHGYEV